MATMMFLLFPLNNTEQVLMNANITRASVLAKVAVREIQKFVQIHQRVSLTVASACVDVYLTVEVRMSKMAISV